MGTGSCNGGGCAVSKVARVLLIVGGLNWGLLGLSVLLETSSRLDVVYLLLGSMPTLEAIVYVLVGAAAVMSLFHCRCAKCRASCVCGTENKGDNGMSGGV